MVDAPLVKGGGELSERLRTFAQHKPPCDNTLVLEKLPSLRLRMPREDSDHKGDHQRAHDMTWLRRLAGLKVHPANDLWSGPATGLASIRDSPTTVLRPYVPARAEVNTDAIPPSCSRTPSSTR